MSRKGKSIERESRLMVARGCVERGNGERLLNQHRISVRDDEKSLELDVLAVQHYECTKYYSVVHCMNFTSIKRGRWGVI